MIGKLTAYLRRRKGRKTVRRDMNAAEWGDLYEKDPEAYKEALRGYTASLRATNIK